MAGVQEVPDWRRSTAGARTRVALWLVAEIAEGGRFTKADLRDAFPAVEQVDRRMRDLRKEGWVIATYREDRSLAPDELRLVTVGGPVWEDGYRSRAESALTDKQRQAVFAADGFACVLCGIAAGDVYPDDALQRAKLTVARLRTDGAAAGLRTVCSRCHAADKNPEPDPTILDDIAQLPPDERADLTRWIHAGRRATSRAEVVWHRYRRLGNSQRADVHAELGLPRSPGD